MIVPKPILDALGLATGTKLDLVVDDGRVIATPIKRAVREGWEAASKLVGADELTDDEKAWLDAPNEGDQDWTW